MLITCTSNQLRILAAALASLAPLCALAGNTISTRTGAWEMTTTTNMSGMAMPAMAIPEDALAKLPPAQRARIEAAMGARAGKSHSTTLKSCVTQKDLDENRLIKDDNDSHCTRKVISRSAKSVVLEQNCPAPQAHTARVNMQFPSPTAMNGTIDISRPDGFKMQMTMQGKWLGASCAGIKD